MPHPFLGIGFTSPLFSKFDREETEALLELTTTSDTNFYQMIITSTGDGNNQWNYQIDWGDGNIEDFDETTGSPGHAYSSPGVYEIKINPVAPTDHLFFQAMSTEFEKITMVDGTGSPYWTSMANGFAFHNQITSVSSSLDTSNATIWYGTFFQCRNLTPFPLLDTSSADLMEYVWYDCTSLTSFPLIDTSNVTTMTQCWAHCTELTSFPSIDTSNITLFDQTWQGCSGLTSFPSLNFQNGESFRFTWYNCSGMTAFSGSSQGFSSATDFTGAWESCINLADFASNVFDGCSCTDFYGAFNNCSSLTPQSIENILTSIDSNNTSSGSILMGGTTPGESTWTTAALTAKANLVARSWTIISNT